METLLPKLPELRHTGRAARGLRPVAGVGHHDYQ
ncbi:hypothetical protein ATK36_5190 [Amycolatopsis sulphurea]|uniref:Uncharacterized protein n=1 Tax=Amycolatopsis sulphurea TaxID=76022 RepID=A0A2A9FF40_9PSEU|nr:hypothetical protein ATK36_5190 [Amycolatopsis sulphurea]